LKVQKRPVIVDAWHYVTKEDGEAIIKMFPKKIWFPLGVSILEKDTLKIYTLEGITTADLGDWIVKGVKGELYPVKPEIFKETFDMAGKENES